MTQPARARLAVRRQGARSGGGQAGRLPELPPDHNCVVAAAFAFGYVEGSGIVLEETG